MAAPGAPAELCSAGWNSRLRAGLFAALAAAAFAGAAALRTPEDDDPGAAAAARAAAPRAPVALLAGAFRPIVANLLWMRLVEHVEAKQYEDVLPLAALILDLDPGFEAAWIATGWTIGVDIPGFEDDDAAAWRWRRQGLMQLREGARRNPKSWRIRHRLGFYVEYNIMGRSGMETLFRDDRVANPEGLSPHGYACVRYREAQAIAGHADYVGQAIERLGCAPLAPAAPPR